MGVYTAIRALNGVTNYINKNNIDIGKPKKKTYRAIDEHLNSVFHKFGNENNIKMEKNNSRNYRGSYSPVASNAIKVQENWELFKQWLSDNY